MNHRIEKVLSGGQHGADLGGWEAARGLGVPTGGLMPLGFRTEGTRRPDGTLGPDEEHPEYAELYGATQHHSRDYPPRTRANVRAADLTLIFNVGPDWSRGTLSAAGAARGPWGGEPRPFIVVELEGLGAMLRVVGLARDRVPGHPGLLRRAPGSHREALEMLRDALARRETRTLNVAGNRESSHPGIGLFVRAFVDRLLDPADDLRDPESTPNECGPDATPPEPAPAG